MTALEERLRTELHSFDPWALRTIRPPRNPDPYVFGEPYRREEPSSWPATRCPVHDVGWNGELRGCWCCAAGMPALNNY